LHMICFILFYFNNFGLLYYCTSCNIIYLNSILENVYSNLYKIKHFGEEKHYCLNRKFVDVNVMFSVSIREKVNDFFLINQFVENCTELSK
jgi:hypothetical protein